MSILSLASVAFASASASAQYYQTKPEDGTSVVVKATRHDSVIVTRYTPFDLPAVPDSIKLTYHEPMPDSIMPASAVVVGQISLRMEDIDDIVPAMEEYAHKAGADWIVSFNEPRAVKTKEGTVYFKSSALLMKVLDPTFVSERDLKYCYYEDQNMQNYADLQLYLDKHMQMGAKLDTPQPSDETDDASR